MKHLRIHRLLRLITLIQGSPNLNAKRLATTCDICERNIYRDIDILKDAGVPISFDPECGGYSIQKNFFLRPVDLTLEEAMAVLMLASHVGEQKHIPHLAQAAKAGEKLRAILPDRIREMVNEMLPRMSVSMASAANEPTEDVYTRMHDAIAHRRALQCEYDSPNHQQTTDAEIFRFDPYALYFGQRAWYAVGLHHGRNEIRMLKLCRLKRCIPLDKPYMIPDGFSLDKYFGKAWRMMPSGAGTIHAIQLHFDSTVAETVADTHWHDSQEVRWLKDDSIEVRFEVDGLEEIVWWILSYGPHCQVMKPTELRKRVTHLHAEAAAMDGSKKSSLT